MQYTRTQFTKEYYGLWELGLLLPNPNPSRLFSVKYKKNNFDEYSRVTLKALSVNDALERACYAITYASPWRPEDIDLHAVYDEEENLLWVDEPFYNTIQKENEFRGMERREFLALFGATSAAILFGFKPARAMAGTTTTGLSGTASGFLVPGEQLYTTPGSYSWTVPAGITNCSVVCIGGGSGNNSDGNGAGGGGGLGWKNAIIVTPGSSISAVVGAGTKGASNSGGNSYFSNIVYGYGASGCTNAGSNGGGYVGDGGGSGGHGGAGSGGGAGGGGGTGGYSGNGGNGGTSGGGYGGGGGGYDSDGSGGGRGGSGGTNGGSRGSGTNIGGAYGAGGGVVQGPGGPGAVRILWGAGRSFPSNAT